MQTKFIGVEYVIWAVVINELLQLKTKEVKLQKLVDKSRTTG